ncbi:choline/carnitine O-acyltransferase [Mesorhizobium sp. M1334]|uniref:choline/carnitine O-acyltransferase n=1 Tax=Mesorhizobium sp. M1334 TaxID=2957084 RepID=UPI003335FC0F
MPLPRLEDSCTRFLEWCAPLLTKDQLARTRTEVEQFLAGPGPALHAALAEYDESGVASWLDRFWKSRYLGTRARIALNWNFFFLLADSGKSQVDRAAGLIASAVHYKMCLDAETISPGVLRGNAQSMVQHKYLFATTRIPGIEQDTARTPYSEQEPGPARARHVVVFYRNNLFRLDVIGQGGAPHTFEDLKAGLRAVIQAGSAPAEDDMSPGSLTTMARAEWAASREALKSFAGVKLDLYQRLGSRPAWRSGLCRKDLHPAEHFEPLSDHVLRDARKAREHPAGLFRTGTGAETVRVHETAPTRFSSIETRRCRNR